MLTIMLLFIVANPFTDYVCFSDDGPEVFSKPGADWSYMVGATEVTFTATTQETLKASTDVVDGVYAVVHPFEHLHHVNRWFAVLDPQPPLPPGTGPVCLFGIWKRTDHIFGDGAESGDLSAWGSVVGDARLVEAPSDAGVDLSGGA